MSLQGIPVARLLSVFPSIDDIWLCLTFDPSHQRPTDDHFVFLGQVFSTNWAYHYQYTLGSTANWIHSVSFDRAIKAITQG